MLEDLLWYSKESGTTGGSDYGLFQSSDTSQCFPLDLPQALEEMHGRLLCHLGLEALINKTAIRGHIGIKTTQTDSEAGERGLQINYNKTNTRK